MLPEAVIGDATYTAPTAVEALRLAYTYRAAYGAVLPAPLDCDDLAGRFRLWAAAQHAGTSIEGIAIGEAWVDGHAFNVVILDSGEIRFMDLAKPMIWCQYDIDDLVFVRF
jgi:hypothetical protein